MYTKLKSYFNKRYFYCNNVQIKKNLNVTGFSMCCYYSIAYFHSLYYFQFKTSLTMHKLRITSKPSSIASQVQSKENHAPRLKKQNENVDFSKTPFVSRCFAFPSITYISSIFLLLLLFFFFKYTIIINEVGGWAPPTEFITVAWCRSTYVYVVQP